MIYYVEFQQFLSGYYGVYNMKKKDIVSNSAFLSPARFCLGTLPRCFFFLDKKDLHIN